MHLLLTALFERYKLQIGTGQKKYSDTKTTKTPPKKGSPEPFFVKTINLLGFLRKES